MKVAFNRRDKDPTMGPYIFLERLAKYFGTRNDIEVTRASRYHDIHLVTIQGSCRRADQYKAKKVLRVDGVYFDASTNVAERNGPIMSTYHDADAIIYQSKFSQQMVHKHFGLPKRAQHETIIYNGVSGMFKPCQDGIVYHDYGCLYSIVACARWRPDKRLSSIIKSFLLLERDDTTLNIFGEVPESERVVHPRICYYGFVNPYDMWRYYASATVMLHPAYVDWCPNSVVEALRCGIPVITTHNGGVPELIQGCGIVVRADLDYNMEFFDHKNIPEVNTKTIATALNLILDNQVNRPIVWGDIRDDLSIEICGDQYVKFFEQVRGK